MTNKIANSNFKLYIAKDNNIYRTKYNSCSVFLSAFEININTPFEVEYTLYAKNDVDELIFLEKILAEDGSHRFTHLKKNQKYVIRAEDTIGKYISKAVDYISSGPTEDDEIDMQIIDFKDNPQLGLIFKAHNLLGDKEINLENHPSFLKVKSLGNDFYQVYADGSPKQAYEFDIDITDNRPSSTVKFTRHFVINDGYSKPLNVSIEFLDNGSAIIRWSGDGTIDYYKLYFDNQPLKNHKLPEAVGNTGLTTFIINDYPLSETRYLKISSLRHNIEKFCDEIIIDAFDKSINPLIGPSVNYSINQNNDLVVYLNHNSTTVDNYSVYLEENEITSIDGLTPIATSTSKNIVIPNFDVYNNYDRTLKLLATTNKYNHSYLSENKDLYVAYDWTPRNLASQSKIWLDTDSGIISTSGSVQTWSNKGLLGGSFNQQDSTARPMLSQNALNGHSIVDFDGSNDLLLASSEMLNVYRNTLAFWVFAVAAKRTIAAKDFQIFEISNPSGTGTMFSLCATETIEQTKWTGYGKRLVSDTGRSVIDSHEANDTNFHMGFMSADFTNNTLFIGTDGYTGISVSTITSGTTADVNCARIVLGSNSSIDYWSNVSIASIVVGNGSIPSIDERRRLEGWAAHKYGLTDNLPSDHPYKTRRPVIDHTPINLTAEFKND